MRLKFIEDTLAESFPHINREDHIWNELVRTSDYGVGWHHLLIELMIKIEEIHKVYGKDITEFKVEQIKEKYGQLRIYASSSINEVHHMISEYERKADTICDECGAETGSLHTKDGWLQTLCERCANAEDYKKAE